jgi:hypothetical protein
MVGPMFHVKQYDTGVVGLSQCEQSERAPSWGRQLQAYEQHSARQVLFDHPSGRQLIPLTMLT